jgi:hypothetical protein
VKISKKGDFENPTVLNCNFSAVFPIVGFPGDPKTALTGDPLYFDIKNSRLRIRRKNYSAKVDDKTKWFLF